jgi:hypothetical protein
MKAMFRKHIPKIESAIMQHPTSSALWNIWLWMANGVGGYEWEKFVGGIEPIVFSASLSSTDTIPSVEASVWIVQQARARKDWGTAIKFAKVARLPIQFKLTRAFKTEWNPGPGVSVIMTNRPTPPKGHPIETVYVPHLEALLQSGDIEGANSVYDEMIRIEGNKDIAPIAAVARSLGMEDVAKTWENGEQVNRVQSIAGIRQTQREPFIMMSKWPSTYTREAGYISSDLEKKLDQALSKLGLRERVSLTPMSEIQRNLGWTEDEDKWALVSSDRRILHQETSIPEFETVKAVMARYGIKSKAELFRQYIQGHPSALGVELLLASEILPYRDTKEGEQDEALALEALGLYNKALRESPDSFVYGRSFGFLNFIDEYSNPTKPLMEPLLKPMLSNLESLLERKPSAENIWTQWLFWNKVEGKGRPLESLAERVVSSPFSGDGILDLPTSVLDAYLEELKKNGNWHKASALLKSVWDRYYYRATEISGGLTLDSLQKAGLHLIQDSLQNAGLHLIQAYLQEGRQGEADDIFRAVMEFGSKFRNISKIVELAKVKGLEKLATEWQKANDKQANPPPSFLR